jgi:hypothetical protein
LNWQISRQVSTFLASEQRMKISPQERVSLSIRAWGHNAELWHELHERLKPVMGDVALLNGFGYMQWLGIVEKPAPRMTERERN